MNAPRDLSQAVDMESDLGGPKQRAYISRTSSRSGRGPSSSPRDYRDEEFDSAEDAASARARSRHPGISPWLFVMATALNTMVAAVLAVIITLGVVRQARTDSQRELALASAAYNRPPTVGLGSEPTASVPTRQPISLRPIGSQDQPLRLEAQKPAPLHLQILPKEAALEPFILVLSGAPAGTTLSGVSRIGSDTWFLPPGSADMLEITLPEWSTSVFEITIAVRRTNGVVAAQTQAWIAVPPPASQEATAPKIDAAAVKDLLARGDRLLEKGDIIAARAVYQRAADMGSASAAMTLGATDDPSRLWSLGALGMVGN